MTSRSCTILLSLAGLACLLPAAGCQTCVPCQTAAGRHAMRTEKMVTRAKAKVPQIGPERARALIQGEPDLFILDVRTKEEYDEAHLASAVLIPRGLLEFVIDANLLYPEINDQRKPRENQPILVYCKTGGRSALAAATLKDLGFTHVRNLAGGLAAWQEKGYPVEVTEKPASTPQATAHAAVPRGR